MRVFLVTAPEHNRSGYANGLIDAGHGDVLVSFLKYIDPKFQDITGFERHPNPDPKHQPLKDDHE